MKRMLWAAIIAMTLAPSAGISQDFETARAAFLTGDYAVAIREWTPLAEQGDADAQFNLGMMYDDGLGVPQDYLVSNYQDCE